MKVNQVLRNIHSGELIKITKVGHGFIATTSIRNERISINKNLKGSHGDILITGPVQLTGDLYANNLTVRGNGRILGKGYSINVKGVLDVSGEIPLYEILKDWVLDKAATILYGDK